MKFRKSVLYVVVGATSLVALLFSLSAQPRDSLGNLRFTCLQIR